MFFLGRVGLLAGGDVLFNGNIVGNLSPGVPDGGEGGGFPIQLAAFLPVVKFALPLPAGGEGNPHLPVGFGGHFAGFEHPGIFAPHFVKGVTGHRRELRVDILDGPLEVGDHHGGRTLFDGARELAQGGLGLLAFRDVAGAAGHAGQPALFIKNGGLDDFKPMGAPGGVPQAMLRAPGLARTDGFPVRRQ